MGTLAAIYRQIQGIDDVTVDRAMAAALPTADRQSLRLIALLLLKRNHPEGTLGLVLHYHELPHDLRQTIVDRADDLFRPIREAAGRRNTHGPANAIQIIERSLNTRLAYLVSEQLRHGGPELQAQAAACLLHLARQAATDLRPGVMPTLDAVAAGYLVAPVREAVQTYGTHEQEAVLRAAAWLLPRRLDGVLTVLNELRHPARVAMADLLRRADQPAIRRSMLMLAGLPALAEATLEGLRHCVEAGTLGEALGAWHLLRLPEVATPIAKAAEPETLCPSIEQVGVMPAHEARGVPAWLTTLPLERGEKIRRLARLRHIHDPGTRLLALRRLLDLAAEGPGEGVQDVIATFCDDPDLAVARVALRHLVRVRYEGLSRLLAQLVNSSHPELRRFAGEQLAPIGFSRLWEAWPRLDEPRRLAAGRALIKIDPNFHRHLAEKLHSEDRKWRLRALNMIHGLNQGAFFEPALIELADSDDEVVASAAVKALATAGSDRALQSLERAIEHKDTRVRANAVEALSQARSTRHVRKLIEMADRDENRPRANAIGALMQMKIADALPALTRMLADQRSTHRASALWLVESMGVLEVARHVAEMSISDPDDEVRRRADRVIHEMMALMHGALSAHAELQDNAETAKT